MSKGAPCKRYTAEFKKGDRNDAAGASQLQDQSKAKGLPSTIHRQQALSAA